MIIIIIIIIVIVIIVIVTDILVPMVQLTRSWY